MSATISVGTYDNVSHCLDLTMKTLKIYGNAINDRFIEEAADALRDGKLIIYPTDTLYAIGCDTLNSRAVEKTCRIKGINPKKQNLAICCSSVSQAASYAKIDNRAFDILRRALPGPFTFILPASPSLPKVFKDRKEVGIRVPDDPVARRLAEELGNPLLTTTIELDDIADADDDLAQIATMEIAMKYESDIDLCIDAGSRGTVPSTIIDLTDSSNPVVIRQGKGTIE